MAFIIWILLHIGIAFVKINGKRHLERADIFKRRREAAAEERKEQEERSLQEQEAREVQALLRRKTIRTALLAQSPGPTVTKGSKQKRSYLQNPKTSSNHTI